jgi:hypothetical protein
MLSDFGGFPAGRACATYPVRDLDGLMATVAKCFSRKTPMRVRCFSHSMNGMSVPRPNEMLLDMTGVRHLVWNGDGTITAGAGLSVVELDRYVRQFGWKLQVTNDGGAEAPSVGGFIAAGGIGESAIFYGGFWETVSKVTLVLGNGSVRRLARDAVLFPWLFGGMGTLGIVYEATLDLVQVGSGTALPVADALSLPRSSPVSWPKHVWLTLFVDEGHREVAAERLNSLIDAHHDAWKPRRAYEYYLKRRYFNPPLLFDGATDFVAIGVWGDRFGEDMDLGAYQKLEADFQSLVEQSGLRRYFQSELIREPRALRRYVGTVCANEYMGLKLACDPEGLLNAHFFAA